MSYNKSPGSHGSGVLTNTQRENIIILTPKRNKNQFITNVSYRSIILLNTDYKIIAKVTNSRMKCSLNELICFAKMLLLKKD